MILEKSQLKKLWRNVLDNEERTYLYALKTDLKKNWQASSEQRASIN